MVLENVVGKVITPTEAKIVYKEIKGKVPITEIAVSDNIRLVMVGPDCFEKVFLVRGDFDVKKPVMCD